jgi:hypothetical protein
VKLYLYGGEPAQRILRCARGGGGRPNQPCLIDGRSPDGLNLENGNWSSFSNGEISLRLGPDESMRLALEHRLPKPASSQIFV